MAVNKVMAEQLGMPSGTAANKLRKMILFKYVQKCGDDICFKCERRINTVEELSIEHKEPWLHNSPDLFWDLDNIAFSHLKCNRPRTQMGGVSPDKVPPNKKWCNDCKEFKPKDDFWPLARNRDGLYHYCKTHAYARKNEHRKLLRG